MIRVLLADDETLIREALALLLELEDDLVVVGQASNGTDAVELTRQLQPDVAVLDLQMPYLNGIEVTEQIAGQAPGCRCILLTSHGRPGYVKRALASGASGFLPKAATRTSLAEVIRRVHSGDRYVDADLARAAITTGDSPLAPREADVLEAAADGAPVEEIARRCSLAIGTTRNYLSSAMSKLNAANRYEAATIARTNGWI